VVLGGDQTRAVTAADLACRKAIEHAENGRWGTFLEILASLPGAPGPLLAIHARFLLKFLLTSGSAVIADHRRTRLPEVVGQLRAARWLGADILRLLSEAHP
jgi:hypothetical protein